MKNRKRNRMLGFNYSSNNLYFVTICVQNNLCCLGSVIHKGAARELFVPILKNHHSKNQNSAYKMELNAFGLIVEERIQWLANQYKYEGIHNFVVMPNHVHIIIEIDSAKLMVQPTCELSVLKRELSLPKNNSDVKIK